MNIIFLGFFGDLVECLHGEYNFLRNCGPYAFYSKYISPLNQHQDEKLHRGEIQLAHTEHEKNRKYFNFEGGPFVGLKSLLYNLSLEKYINIYTTNECKKLEKYDFIYVHWLTDDLAKKLIQFGNNILDNKLIISSHNKIELINKYFKTIKYKYWSHSSRVKADYYLQYPIHKTILDQNSIDCINMEREYDILIYTKLNGHNKKFKKDLFNNLDKIQKYFSSKNIKTCHLSYIVKGFRRSELLEYSNNSKLCLFLSYFDSGGISASEISIMGCYLIGFFDKETNQEINHSFAPTFIVENETGEYINEFSERYNDKILYTGCDKVINILKTNLDHKNIAKIAREHLTIERFIETIFKK